MLKIQTGRGTIPLNVLVAIWSVSAVVSLPGLAISPILGALDKFFKHATDLEIQMLTSLPSLLIIPFVLLAGKLSVSRNKLLILYTGLALFCISGFFSLFAKNIVLLIFINCVLGVGAGMVIPLSTGLIADHFTGAYRTRQLGISSSISNVTLVLATSLTGWLATVDWHYPFLVYLLPGVALLMTLSLRKYKPDRPAAATIPAVPASPTDAAIGAVKWLPGIDVPRLGGLMLLYFLATYVVLVVTFNLPFLMQHYTLSSSASGVMISLFFLAIMLPGLFITWIIRKLKNATVFLPLLLICAGLLLIYLFKYEWTIGLGCFVAGIGYGVIQPLIYDKSVRTADSKNTTLALALVMSVNYLAILLCPFIVDLLTGLFGKSGSADFPFVLNAAIVLLMAVVGYRYRESYVFGAPDFSE